MLNKILYLLSTTLLLFTACNQSQNFKRKEQRIGIYISEDVENPSASPLLSIFEEVATEQGMIIDTLSDSWMLRLDNLKAYSSLILIHAEVDAFSIHSQTDIERYIEAGGGLMTIASVLKKPYTWPWYQHTVSYHNDSTTAIPVLDSEESLFQLRSFKSGNIAILNTQLTSLMSSTDHKDQIHQALQFTIGENKFWGSKIETNPAPDFNRFTKVVLDDRNVDEPMELTILPDGKVLYIERKGNMKLFDPETSITRIISKFDVCIEGNYEDGLLGVEADPNFEDNHFIYLYYSPSCDIDSQYLSRFEMHGTDSIILESEVVVLTVGVQRETCCHSAGSITFGPEGNLYLSTGDNTSSKESDGYSPIDERPGRSPFDAQKSSANTEDLRGKILRIKVLPDGNYNIPEGNLFPADGSEGRPEIYVMGARNPFRIAVDHQTGFVYWGDVGPDVTRVGKYGPESYDEFNQARAPGYYGWPYFVGNNKAYRDRDFAMDTVGAYFDPARPVNNSPYNTGSNLLPPARGAFIWYGKGPSEEFPMMGVGSNSAMAGPIYYRNTYDPNSTTAFPRYYNGKWFIYEWARSWIQVVSMDREGDITRIEPFMPNMPLSKPIDMEFGPDGAMYILEYGQNYFMNNPEAKLVRIEFAEGNRLPVPIISANTNEGAHPLTVTFSASQSYDNDHTDSLSFSWFIEGVSNPLTGETITHIFEDAGIYRVTLKASDTQKGEATATQEIRVGNSAPKINIALEGNQTFFLDRSEHAYAIDIEDKEDQLQGGIDPGKAQVSFVFVDDGQDLEVLLADPTANIQPSLRFTKGMRLVKNSDCYTCHAEDTASVGPSYREVASRYKNEYDALAYLSEKIIQGSNGVWGEKIMPGHPQHSLAETQEMVKYILSLGQQPSKNLPLEGTIITNQHTTSDDQGKYVLSATYTDDGWKNIPEISRRSIFVLRHPRVQAEHFDLLHDVNKRIVGKNRNITAVNCSKKDGYIALKDIDLTHVSDILVNAQPVAGGIISVRLDSETGTEIGQLSISESNKDNTYELRPYTLNITQTTGKHDVYFSFSYSHTKDGNMFFIDWVEFILDPLQAGT